MLNVEEWLLIRDLYLQGLSISEISRRTGYARETIRNVNSSYKFPISSSYKIPKSQSLRKLEDFKYAEYGGMVIDKRIILSRL